MPLAFFPLFPVPCSLFPVPFFKPYERNFCPLAPYAPTPDLVESPADGES
jgi:hypothetical protein